MKKLIFILAIMFIGIGIATAQTDTYNIASKNTYRIINTDYTLTNTVATWFLWKAERNFTATQDFQVNLDSLSGDHTNVAVSLYGRKFSTDSWTQIGSTVDWLGATGGDTTITISNTSINRYREYKFNLLGTGTGTTTIDWQQFKIWNE